MKTTEICLFSLCAAVAAAVLSATQEVSVPVHIAPPSSGDDYRTFDTRKTIEEERMFIGVEMQRRMMGRAHRDPRSDSNSKDYFIPRVNSAMLTPNSTQDDVRRTAQSLLKLIDQKNSLQGLEAAASATSHLLEVISKVIEDVCVWLWLLDGIPEDFDCNSQEDVTMLQDKLEVYITLLDVASLSRTTPGDTPLEKLGNFNATVRIADMEDYWSSHVLRSCSMAQVAVVSDSVLAAHAVMMRESYTPLRSCCVHSLFDPHPNC